MVIILGREERLILTMSGGRKSVVGFMIEVPPVNLECQITMIPTVNVIVFQRSSWSRISAGATRNTIRRASNDDM